MRADWIKLRMAAARLYRCAGIQQITSSSARVPSPYLVLDLVVVDGAQPLVQVARQRYPAFRL